MVLIGVELDDSALPLLAAASAMLAWLVPHRLAVAQASAVEFRQASAGFRSAVLSALRGLYPTASEWPERKLDIIGVLERRFPELQIAVAEFRPYLPWFRRWTFDRAWRVYRLGKDRREIDGQYYWQYIPHVSDYVKNGRPVHEDNEARFLDDFKANVERLLRHASET